MKNRIALILLTSLIALNHGFTKNISIAINDEGDRRSGYSKYEGFFDFYWSKEEGRIYLDVEKLEEEFLYVNSLAAGVGSNDIGLDRGQIGNQRVVKFIRSGPKLLLIQPNYDYRAISDNREEVRSVNEAFAQSVLWGFFIEDETGGKMLIDITEFLLADAHGISETLKEGKQGNYSVDLSRSSIYLPMTKNFSDNSEFESLLTFGGTPTGSQIRSVTPSPESISVRLHHSFVRLPDNKYQPRDFDPRSGLYAMSYQDYATPIEESLVKRLIYRHRLEKKNPEAAMSEPVKPIIYYVDKGAPEPIKSALIEGASWWNEAFEAAGYINAFQVFVLPDSADPLDINYNVIQWVHRSTRGWSYGSWIADPRTGEILKGQVSLGSLRVRQDYLIATGILQPYQTEETPDDMLEMALARVRQLSAHEVGHTLGLYHNFAASTDDRASVMDYPHPNIKLDKDGAIDLSDAYDTGIGAWDKFAIRYGYTDFSENSDEKDQLNGIINEWIDQGLHYINDNDARPVNGANSLAHLWDNGSNPALELDRISTIRKTVIDNFSERAIQTGAPLSSIEEVLVPMYFLHRYQIEAVSKLIGGYQYAYKLKGDKLPYHEVVSASEQSAAIKSLSKTLTPDFLIIPDNLLKILSPKVPGYSRSRESFKSNTGPTFDPIAAAETAAEMTLSMMFNPQRIERLIQQQLIDDRQPGWNQLMESIYSVSWDAAYPSGLKKEIKMAVEKRVVFHLMNLTINSSSTEATKAMANQELENLIARITKKSFSDSMIKAHYNHTLRLYSQFLDDPHGFEIPQPLDPPDGSPIGMDCFLD